MRDKQEDLQTLAIVVLMQMVKEGMILDEKRPFGNSDIDGDVAELIGLDLPDEEEYPEEFERSLEYCWELWSELPAYILSKLT